MRTCGQRLAWRAWHLLHLRRRPPLSSRRADEPIRIFACCGRGRGGSPGSDGILFAEQQSCIRFPRVSGGPLHDKRERADCGAMSARSGRRLCGG
eukprot:3693756-Prymnesium_polylepis.1